MSEAVYFKVSYAAPIEDGGLTLKSTAIKTDKFDEVMVFAQEKADAVGQDAFIQCRVLNVDRVVTPNVR